MKFEMKMPDLATTASSIRILGWLKKPGDSVKRGEAALEIETDKAAMEVEATINGFIVETKADVGAEVNAGDVIAIIETDEPVGASPTIASSSSSTVETKPIAGSELANSPGKGMFARNRETATHAAGSREPLLARAPRMSIARRIAARRLQESKQTIPHFYLNASARAAAIVARRYETRPTKLVWDAFFVKAASSALRHFPEIARRYQDESLVAQETTRIGVAVDLDGDLYVVSVEVPETKSIEQISDEIQEKLEGLRAGDPGLRQVKPGVMTISNLGGTGVESFSAIINPPESAILAVGALRDVVVIRGASFAVEPRINLTLSVDHRVVNGKYAAQFLAAIVKEIEEP